MSIPFACQACGKRFKADDRLAGRTVACPNCQQPVSIPDPEDAAPGAAYGVKEPEVRPPLPALYLGPAKKPVEVRPPQPKFEPPLPVARPLPRTEPRPAGSLPIARRLPDVGDEPPDPPVPTIVISETPAWLRHLHWVLALALIPLVVSLLHKDAGTDDVVERIEQTISQLPSDRQERARQTLAQIEEGNASEDELFRLLPRERLIGAFLPHSTIVHWLMALMAIVLFMTFFMLLAVDRSAKPWHLLCVGLFTATIGIFTLLLIQLFAAVADVMGVPRGPLIIVAAFFKLIAFSYKAATDPSTNFILSFFGFTVGVGFCEEAIKILPVMVRFGRPSRYSWRNAFLWGLASGAGFGISEGIIYSSDFYNGITGPGIYLVRFLSCVALHAVWTGAAAITLHRLRHLIHREQKFYEYIVPMLVFIALPMILHGLYDTFLKKDMTVGALVIAAFSFAFLAVLIYKLRDRDDERKAKKLMRLTARAGA